MFSAKKKRKTFNSVLFRKQVNIYDGRKICTTPNFWTKGNDFCYINFRKTEIKKA